MNAAQLAFQLRQDALSIQIEATSANRPVYTKSDINPNFYAMLMSIKYIISDFCEFIEDFNNQ